MRWPTVASQQAEDMVHILPNNVGPVLRGAEVVLGPRPWPGPLRWPLTLGLAALFAVLAPALAWTWRRPGAPRAGWFERGARRSMQNGGKE